MVANRNLHEARRLASLHRYNVLDTPAEDGFDRITRLAQQLLQVPIALISLVDENRQWFKSKRGLDVSETPREISFCTHAIKGDEAFLVRDALEDERFRENPLVTGEPHIRFYLGIPLKMSDGFRIGTLCAIDREPRIVTTEQFNALYDLARLTVDQLEMRQIAITDSLTGLLNLRGFNLHVQKLAEDEPTGRTSSFMMMNIDDFDSINESYNHAAADRVLQNVASLCRTRLGPKDVFARLGADEFAIIGHDTNQEEALKKADELRSTISLVGTPYEDVLIDITVSLAVAFYDSGAENITYLMKPLGDALRKCRVKGGNHIALVEHRDEGAAVA